MKKILLLVICFISFSLFCGCANVNYIVEYKSSGEIEQTFSVALDRQIIEENGYSYLDISTTIHNLYSNYLNNKQQSMQENLDKNPELTNQEKIDILSSIKKEITATESEITLIIVYPNRDIASLVNTDPTQEEDSDEDVKYIDHFLTKTMVQNITNIYNGYHESELYTQLNSLYNKNNEFKDEDLSLTQVVAFSNNRYKSNADNVIAQNGMYYHIWKINSTIDQNGQYATTKMELYVTTAKPVMWYVLAVIIVVIFIAVSFVYVKYAKIKQNKLK